MNFIDSLLHKSSAQKKRIVFPESSDSRVLVAANEFHKHSYGIPVLIGDFQEIHKTAALYSIELSKEIECISPESHPALNEYAAHLYERRKQKGMSREEAEKLVREPLYFAASLLQAGEVEGCVAGSIATTADVLKTAMHVIGLGPGSSVVSGVFIMSFPDSKVWVYGDCAVVPEPDAIQLASIASDSAKTYTCLTGKKPAVAMLSFSTKGSAQHTRTELVREATEIARKKVPGLVIDGELQFDAAMIPSISERKAPDSPLKGNANVFIFPNLDAGNIAYKITERIGGATAIGPIIQGLAKPMMDLSRGCTARDIICTAAVCALLSE